MKFSTLRSEQNKDESWKPIKISVSVIGLSGSCQVKGTVGVGKSSLCNRLVRPDHYNHKQLSSLSEIDYHNDVINGSSWIYWDHIIETLDGKVYAVHVIEQTVLISDQNFLPFVNDTESEYTSRAVSDRIVGSKMAFVSPAQFSRSQHYDAVSITDSQTTIDAFILVIDVSDVTGRDCQTHEKCVSKLLSALHKAKKPVIIVLSKFDIKCPKIKARFDSLLEKQNLRSIPVIETSANLNINIAQIPSILISEINHHHRPLTLTKKLPKVPTFDDALILRRTEKINYLTKLKQMVNAEVTKTYDLTWEKFSSGNDLSLFCRVFDKSEMVSEFVKYKESMVSKINESLMAIYMVFFKKVCLDFIPSILNQEPSASFNITEVLLQNPTFLQNFQEEDIDEFSIFLAAHLYKKIDFPLPRFLIDVNHRLNKLHLIDSCIEEIKFQKIEMNFAAEFQKRLELNSESYEDLSFVEVENRLRDLPMLNRFRELASSIFSNFVEGRVSQFKLLFDEKLLELSFMIFICGPVKTCMKKCNIKEKEYKEAILDMGLINSINNKIYFDDKKFEKRIYDSQRIKWVVKYIASLISSNPRECYHFDFNVTLCLSNLMDYLGTFKTLSADLTVVISFDRVIDEYWTNSDDNKTIIIDDKYTSSIDFIPSYEVNEENFWKYDFSPYQKLIILIYEIQNDIDDIMEKILNRNDIYHDQLSFITLERGPLNSDTQRCNLVISRVNDLGNNIYNNISPDLSLISVVKSQTLAYVCQRKPINMLFVVLCDEAYDHSIPASFFLSLFDDCLVLEQHCDMKSASISMLYIPVRDYIPQRINITILSYHQVFKLLNDKVHDSLAIHLVMYFCDLNRLASVNTMFAVLQNLLTVVVSIKFVICPIKSSDFFDIDECENRTKMVQTLAYNSRVLCVIIENDHVMDRWFSPDVDDVRCLKEMIIDCVRKVNNLDESKNQCKYNSAYETEDLATVTRRSIQENGHINSEFSKGHSDKARNCRPDENGCYHSSFGSQERTLSQSDSLISPDITSSDQYFSQDQTNCVYNFSKIEFVDSEPLGSFNEHLFCPIEEEDSFCTDVEDAITRVDIICTNINHIGFSNDRKTSQPSSKFRSFSGPAQITKCGSRKYSSAQNPFNRSQRYSSKKSQSLTTSPSTSYMKTCAHKPSMCCNCKDMNEHSAMCPSTSVNAMSTTTTPPKGIKSAFSRFFLSDRSNNKSAEEKRSIFGRSFKFSKKNSDKRNKNMPVTNHTSSDVQFPRHTHSTSSFVLPPCHSTPGSVVDTRPRTKSLSKTVFSL